MLRAHPAQMGNGRDNCSGGLIIPRGPECRRIASIAPGLQVLTRVPSPAPDEGALR